MVLPNFVTAALEGRPLLVHGTGEQSRCFGHVADAVESMVRLMETPTAFGEVFNVANDEEVTIRTLAERVIRATGSGSEIRTVPYSDVYPEGFEDMARRVPDVSKLERFTGYRPRTPLAEIIADIVAEKRAGTSGSRA
jgi:UDP-glucose 4-epimerase